MVFLITIMRCFDECIVTNGFDKKASVQHRGLSAIKYTRTFALFSLGVEIQHLPTKSSSIICFFFPRGDLLVPDDALRFFVSRGFVAHSASSSRNGFECPELRCPCDPLS